MGMLHDGHMSLVRLAAQQTPSVIVSIYANPSQLTTHGEKRSYPSTFDSDLERLIAVNDELRHNCTGVIRAIFAPVEQEMYPCSPPDSIPQGIGSFVNILPLTSVLEGRDRPSHFVGVSTICLKLFNAARPNSVFFGEKDFQQTIIIKRLVQDFLLDIKVVVGKTVREIDGLAMSSRNLFLGTRRRAVATIMVRAMQAVRDAYEQNIMDRNQLLSVGNRIMDLERVKQEQLPKGQGATFAVIYFDLADPESLESLITIDPKNGAVLCGAIQMLPLNGGRDGEDQGLRGGADSVRLIDSIILYLTEADNTSSKSSIV
ncbi:MAG: hypothetical protein Q9198_006458 [Flavoplaca austrocitrina]